MPYEILTDPQSMPAHPAPKGDVATMHTGKEERDNAVEEKTKVGPGPSNPPAFSGFVASGQISMEYKLQPERVRG